jgi:pimeloyl-ACP methyl ester carboxylesterase
LNAQRHLFSLVLVLILSLILITSTATAQEALPRIEPTDCGFETWHEDLFCGDLVVPQDRSNPNAGTIRLRFAVFPAWGEGEIAADPVVYLEGGPGGDLLTSMPWAYSVIETFNEKRPVVLFDQRGTGLSRPGLDCPEYDNTVYEMLGEDAGAATTRQRILDALNACKRRLESRGVSLSAYNSVENAADLDDLRVALGYEQWNLYGISYGTRLALTAMRDTPDGIRSVIIDSVLPLEVHNYDEMPANLDRALNTFFLDCALNAECNAAYPRLGTRFYETVAQLNATPAEVRINHPTTQVEYVVRVDGSQLVGVAFGSLYNPSYIYSLPAIIQDAHAGDYSLLARGLEAVLQDQEGFSMGMHFAVQCSEEAPFALRESVVSAISAFPALSSYFETEPITGTMILDICQAWGLRAAVPDENAPVTSPIPTLVMAGQYDPITPPRWARMVADALPNSYYYEYPGQGHGVTVGDYCASEMALAFVDNPTAAPDSSCMADIPPMEFFIVDDSALSLVAFSDGDARLRSVRPESWDGYGAQFYPVSLDETLLSFGSLEVRDYNAVASADYIMDYILEDVASDFDVYDLPPPIERRSANGFDWAIYEFRRGDRYLHIAAATRDTRVYWVLMQTDRFEKDALYMEVFTPAIDNLEAF